MPLFLQDARYGLRLLVRRPGFSLVAVLTLALGIGAATSIFSVVEAVLLRPMPFPNPDRLVLMGIIGRNAGEFPLPDSDFVEWRERNRTADAVAAYSEQRINITGDGQPERVQGAVVTDQFFRILGTPAERGRVFQEGDDRPGAQKVAVISHRFWQRRFNSRADIVGQTAVLGGLPHTIVGVMPPTFAFPWHDTDVWAVLTMNPPVRRGPFYTNGLARLKEGVTMDQLRANLKDVAAEMKRRYPGPSDWRLDAKPLQEAFVAAVSRILWVLLGAVGFLLLIATANVANLLLARAATREREMALRGALGAGGWRIVAQLLTESVVLAIAAGAAGVAFAAWGTRAILALAPDNIPRVREVGMNVPVLLFALGTASICGVLFGVAPALRARRIPLIETLKQGGRSGGGSHRRAQRALVVAEIALALVLSIAAGLMVRSFTALSRVNPGFPSDHLLTFGAVLPQTKYDTGDKVEAFYSALVAKIESLPGVKSAGINVSMPPNRLAMTDNFMIEGQTLPPNTSAPVGPLMFVNESYFTTLGVPLIRGRFFEPRDTRGAPDVVIVNETLAKRFFADGDPIGKRLKDGGPERPDNAWMTIVGVVGNVPYDGLDAAPEPAFYLPFRQNRSAGMYVVVRTTVDPQSAAPAVRSAVTALDPELPVTNLKTMDTLMTESVASPKFRTLLVAMFAGVGLLLAAIGIYGVMAYAVTERTHELGIRVALGADRGDVLRLVLIEAAVLAGIGVALGVGGAAATTRLMTTLLFGVTPTDTVTFSAISAFLIATALLASYIPARRATRVDPLIALRADG
ncbi:MAG TPA: ABC transporter permease [Vicinamibacterales bacterium]|nr:ABC transporter permease [Vicinamibacterales bacterium]